MNSLNTAKGAEVRKWEVRGPVEEKVRNKFTFSHNH